MVEVWKVLQRGRLTKAEQACAEISVRDTVIRKDVRGGSHEGLAARPHPSGSGLCPKISQSVPGLGPP